LPANVFAMEQGLETCSFYWGGMEICGAEIRVLVADGTGVLREKEISVFFSFYSRPYFMGYSWTSISVALGPATPSPLYTLQAACGRLITMPHQNKDQNGCPVIPPSLDNMMSFIVPNFSSCCIAKPPCGTTSGVLLLSL
jgi:hypothetical protein